MPNEVIVVYQDCPTCGARKKWGERTIQGALSMGIPVRKVSFASIEGQKHAMNAILAGITSYPFVTDGKTYAKELKDLLQAESEAPKAKKVQRKTKKSVKTEKGQDNGADSEN